MTLWEGRMPTGMAEAVAAFTVSLPFDRTLAPDDLAGSRAHVKGLGKAGILSDSEVASLIEALDLVEEEFTIGAFVFAPDDEDVHTAIERRVTELAGDAGAKLHTGRSRNDQVATALRLWCRRRSSRWPTRSWRWRTRWRSEPPMPETSTCRATPTCNGRSRSCWPTTCWLTGGLWRVTWTGSSPPWTD